MELQRIIKRGIIIIILFSMMFQSNIEALAISENLININGNFGYILLNGESNFEYSEGLMPASVNKKWGYISKFGQYIIEPQFDRAYAFKEGIASIERNSKFAYINKQGQIISAEFEYARPVKESMGAVKQNGKYGYVDSNGKEVISPKFDEVSDFSDGVACVMTIVNGVKKFGFIDKTGGYVLEPDAINPPLEAFANFVDGFAWTSVNFNKYGLIDKYGFYVISPKYHSKPEFSEELALVSYDKEDKSIFIGFIDATGNVKVEPTGIKEAGPFKEGLAYVRYTDGKVGYDYALDKYLYEKKQEKKRKELSVSNSVYNNSVKNSVYGTGSVTGSVYGTSSVGGSVYGESSTRSTTSSAKKEVFNYKPFINYSDYKSVNSSNNSEDWIAYIDNTGFPAFGINGSYGESFSEGLAVVCNGKKYGYIDKTGNYVIEPKFEDACSFKEGFAKVKLNGKWGLINKNGENIVDFTLTDDFEGNYFNNGLALSRRDKKYGYIDKVGKYVFEPLFDNAEVFADLVAKIQIGGKSGVLFDKRPKIMLNGTKLEFDVPPANVEGRLLVPMRAIFEKLGASLNWDLPTKTVTATKDSTTIAIQIDNKVATVNDKKINLDASATVVNGRTLVPLRFISESLGAKITWTEDDRTVRIDEK